MPERIRARVKESHRHPLLKIGLLDTGHIHAERFSRPEELSPYLAISIRGFR